MRAFGKSSNRPTQRLHPSPSLPNLCHFHQAPDSSLAPITTLTANRSHLGPLDLAPSKIQQRSPSLSPCTSPRRPPLPLTPPLTPSSLNDSASQGGLPATPTDPDSTNATLWRRKSNYLTRKAHPTRVQTTSLVILHPQNVLISPSRRVTNRSLSRHSPAIYVSTLHLVASS
ncbi:hypothetical protein BGY98DRAFT_216132 [Russula aff. rugulosa BPL654]|nr:hypothetical protein BGY98DRAFT_216132 [Russula aff. rugulosa BPL654]